MALLRLLLLSLSLSGYLSRPRTALSIIFDLGRSLFSNILYLQHILYCQIVVKTKLPSPTSSPIPFITCINISSSHPSPRFIDIPAWLSGSHEPENRFDVLLHILIDRVQLFLQLFATIVRSNPENLESVLSPAKGP